MNHLAYPLGCLHPTLEKMRVVGRLLKEASGGSMGDRSKWCFSDGSASCPLLWPQATCTAVYSIALGELTQWFCLKFSFILSSSIHKTDFLFC